MIDWILNPTGNSFGIWGLNPIYSDAASTVVNTCTGLGITTPGTAASTDISMGSETLVCASVAPWASTTP